MFVLVMVLMCVCVCKEVRDTSTMLAKIQLRAFVKVTPRWQRPRYLFSCQRLATLAVLALLKKVIDVSI